MNPEYAKHLRSPTGRAQRSKNMTIRRNKDLPSPPGQYPRRMSVRPPIASPESRAYTTPEPDVPTLIWGRFREGFHNLFVREGPVFKRAKRENHLGGSEQTRSAERRTAEIWSMILGYLPNPSLMALRLTCKAFAAYASPFLFATMTVYPTTPPHILASRSSVLINTTVEAMEILKFYSSRPIANMVQTCRIVGVLSITNNDVVVDAFFNTLWKFPNLGNLVCSNITLTQKLVALIAYKRRVGLRSISIDDCRTKFSGMDVRIQVESLIFGPSWPRRDDPSPWLSVIDHSSVRSLHLGAPVFVDTWLLDLAFLNTFSSLQSLHIYATPGPAFISALSRFPILVELHILPHLEKHIWTPDNAVLPLPASALPMLASFLGPEYCVRSYCRGRPVRRVKLYGGAYGGGIATLDLVQAVRDLRRLCPKLRSLDVRAELPLDEFLTVLCSSFPRLESLHIDVTGYSPEPEIPSITYPYSREKLYAACVQLCFPRHLRTVHICTEFYLALSDGDFAEGGVVVSSWIREHPQLERVYFRYGGPSNRLHWMEWERKGGPVLDGGYDGLQGGYVGTGLVEGDLGYW